MVDRRHREEEDRGDGEDRGRGAGLDGVAEDDEHQATDEGDGRHREVQPAAQLRLDGVEDGVDALLEGVHRLEGAGFACVCS